MNEKDPNNTLKYNFRNDLSAYWIQQYFLCKYYCNHKCMKNVATIDEIFTPIFVKFSH